MNAELNQNINFSYSKFLPERFLNNFSSSDKNIKPDAKKVKYLLYLYAYMFIFMMIFLVIYKAIN
ncbi:hypothetical protein CHL9004_06395 [Campylobacter hyointestinalis subsp. lawsonii]|nr:hypothetical protein CHL9004_06395 [Campylobacter hyointestinalis subsp. lawsonii]